MTNSIDDQIFLAVSEPWTTEKSTGEKGAEKREEKNIKDGDKQHLNWWGNWELGCVTFLKHWTKKKQKNMELKDKLQNEHQIKNI